MKKRSIILWGTALFLGAILACGADIPPTPAPVPKISVMSVDDAGKTEWIQVPVTKDTHLYCFDGQNVNPCVVVDEDKEDSALCLGVYHEKVEEKAPAPVEDKPALGEYPLMRTEK